MPLLSHAGSGTYAGQQAGVRVASLSAAGDDDVGAAESPGPEGSATAAAGSTVLTIAAINAHK
jgi:hypothetical protein